MTLEQQLSSAQAASDRFAVGRTVRQTQPDEPRPKRWTRAEYDRVVEAGILEGQHVELIEGEVLEMSPQGAEHAKAIVKILKKLVTIFGEGYDIRPQLPMAIGGRSEPEPDFSVVSTGSDPDDDHPSQALLIMEISFSTVQFDRNHKARLYAQAGIEDYWIVNIKERQLEVYRRPSAEGYQEQTILTQDDSIAPLAAPNAVIQVKDLLP